MNFKDLFVIMRISLLFFQLREEKDTAFLNAEIKFRRQFEKEAAKVKKDLAEFKEKSSKAQNKIQALENKVKDLLKENDGLLKENKGLR